MKHPSRAEWTARGGWPSPAKTASPECLAGISRIILPFGRFGDSVTWTTGNHASPEPTVTRADAFVTACWHRIGDLPRANQPNERGNLSTEWRDDAPRLEHCAKSRMRNRTRNAVSDRCSITVLPISSSCPPPLDATYLSATNEFLGRTCRGVDPKSPDAASNGGYVVRTGSPGTSGCRAGGCSVCVALECRGARGRSVCSRGRLDRSDADWTPGAVGEAARFEPVSCGG